MSDHLQDLDHGRPSPGLSVPLRVRFSNRPGRLGALTTAIGVEGGNIGAIDIVSASREWITRDITINISSDGHGDRIVKAIERLHDFQVIKISDGTLLLHLGGKIEVVSKTPLKTRADLSIAYTRNGTAATLFNEPLADRRIDRSREDADESAA